MQFRMRSLLIIVLAALFLSACGKDIENVEAENGSDIDLSEYPVGVQNGDVSYIYYSILLEVNTEFGNLHDDLKNAKDTEEKKDLYRKFLVIINGLNYTPLNDTEKEIDNYFSSFLTNAKNYSEYKIKAYDSNSDLDNSMANDYLLDAQNDMLMVAEIMNKYQLFQE